MAMRWPSPGLVVMAVVSTVLNLGLAALGWGSVLGLLAHPARAGVCLALVLLTLVALVSSANLSGGRREDRRSRWIYLPVTLIGLALAWLPAYTDRRYLGTLDGDAVLATSAWRCSWSVRSCGSG